MGVCLLQVLPFFNWRNKTMKKFLQVSLLCSFFMVLCCIPSQAQQIDNFVTCAPYYDSCVLTPLSSQQWTSSNVDWRFPLYYPGGNIRIYIINHNPTNGHTLTPKLWLTADTNTSTTLLNNSDKWVAGTLNDNSTANAKCSSVAAANTTSPGASGSGTCYAVGLHARQAAIQITGAASAAGSPDTFDVIVVESGYYIGGPSPGQDSSAGQQFITGTTPGDAISNTSVPGAQDYQMVFNGTSWDRMRGSAVVGTNIGASAADSDAQANTSIFLGGPASSSNAFPMAVNLHAFNGTTWDRLRSGTQSTTGGSLSVLHFASSSILADVTSNTQILPSNTNGNITNQVFPMVFNGTTWDRWRGATFIGGQTDGDAVANTLLGNIASTTGSQNGFLGIFPHVFNGSSWDRQRSAAGTVGVASVNAEGTKATFTGTATGQTILSGDSLQLCGSGTKTIRIVYFQINGNQTTGNNVVISLIRRSTADTGGTTQGTGGVTFDTNNPVQTATLTSYTAAPTNGTFLGQIEQIALPLATTGNPGTPTVFNWGKNNDQEIVLRGAAQCFELNSVTGGSGSSTNWTLRWTEE